MTAKEGLDKIKLILGFDSQKVEFKNAKLSDGNIISYEGELAVGTIVMVVDEGGAMLPLPIGDYTLEDGTTFSVVDETGTIDNVVMAEAKPEAKEGEVAPVAAADANGNPVAPATAQPKRIIKSEVEEHVFKIELDNEIIEIDFSTIVKSLTDKTDKLEAENIELKKQVETNLNFSKQVAEVVNQIADEPISAPTEANKKFNVSEFRKAYKEDLQNIKKLTN